MKQLSINCALTLCFAATEASGESDHRLVVHEWGTFTSLQDEAGYSIGGINTADEPVPRFVHELAGFLILNPSEMPSIFFQGAPQCHPDVTMRLETPVIYFHHPPSQTNDEELTVRARFRGGWLTEFYPAAEVKAPGFGGGAFHFGRLVPQTESSLEWKDIKIGGEGVGPQTDAHVWTAPRVVHADSIQTTNGERERFLFYRGVAHIDAPLKVSRDTKTDCLSLRSQWTGQPLSVQSLWLVNIRADGTVAFRTLPAVALEESGDKILSETAVGFSLWDFRKANMDALRKALHQALVREGLFDDEAEALLNTWELSYFQSAGLRLFFIVPRAWTDRYLPLEISAPADIRRVMVGRIELVTPEQRLYMKQIGQLSVSQIRQEVSDLHGKWYSSSVVQSPMSFLPGRKPLASAIRVPPGYQAYLKLGRFRNALVLEEMKNRPTPGLAAFIESYRLKAFSPQAGTN